MPTPQAQFLGLGKWWRGREEGLGGGGGCRLLIFCHSRLGQAATLFAGLCLGVLQELLLCFAHVTFLCTIFHVAPTRSPAAEVNACMTSLRFLVTYSMAPLGRLLVYYVREDGEGVTDSLQFAVKPSFENQVGDSFS